MLGAQLPSSGSDSQDLNRVIDSLMRVDGLSFSEISRVTQVGVNTLKSRMNLARKTLEIFLKERGYDGH